MICYSSTPIYTCICVAYIGVLVANKIDLEFQRAIDTKTGEEFASNNSLLYFECSTVSEVKSACMACIQFT